ncbi:hypothetical protein QQF64_033766 [Cirrhinus molitorella]|uniref:Secreted protein n=1 Tax=Cirrhinus molitorella TaxID=172907 RepID=A0ABR3MUU1_9TELE
MPFLFLLFVFVSLAAEPQRLHSIECLWLYHLKKVHLCHVKAAQGKVAETPLHNIKPGDFVVVEEATWIHDSHCRKVPSSSQEEEQRE